MKAIERDPRLAREAQAHFRAALRLSAGPDQDGLSSPELRADLAFSRAGSAFYQAEPIFERILDIRFPPDMDFQPVGRFDGAKVAVARAKKLKASLRKFGAYLHGKNRLIEQMAGPAPTGLYQQVMGYGVPHWNLAALARMAQAQMELAQQLFMAPIPQDLKERDEWGNRPREIFCDKVIDTGEPAEAKAMSGYELCLETARKQSWWNEWSALCEEGLNRMNPARYPLSREMEPEADLAPPPSAPPAVQPDCATCQF